MNLCSVTIAAMRKQKQVPWNAYLALGGGLLLLGFSAIFVSLANAPGTIVGFYRMTFGALILLIPFLLQRRKLPALPKKGIALALLAGAFFGADVSAWASGITLSGPTLPTLFANTNPLWVGLGAWLLFKEKLGKGFWIGLALALSGAALILGTDFSNGLMLDQGMMLGLLASVFYGAYFLVAQSGRELVQALSFFWLSTFGSALTLLVVNLILRVPFTGYPAETWVNFFVQGLVIQSAGWFLISYAQGYLPASVVSPTLLGQPVLTAILAGPILGESLRSGDLIGGGAVLLGIFIVHRSRFTVNRKSEEE